MMPAALFSTQRTPNAGKLFLVRIGFVFGFLFWQGARLLLLSRNNQEPHGQKNLFN
jgi:nitrate/TMAO reductase-like tetraheme cytochrome c subunit